MNHDHDHSHGMTGSRLRLAFFLTCIILLAEVIAGFASNSLALLSDAGHILTDVIALGLAWFASVQAERPADAEKTYGYHRTGILTAQLNAVTLIAIVGVIAFEAYRRLQSPPEVTPWLMFVAAGVAIAVNAYIAFSLRSAGEDNLNVRAAMLHVLGDIGASVGVIVGALIILLTGWNPADPLISLLIAALIAWGAWNILRETIGILMESTPKGLNVAQMVRDMIKEPEVSDVHDLHVWSIAGGMNALSAHVQVRDRPLSECDDVVARLGTMLRVRYRISHTTLQLECAGCASNHLYCQPDANGRSEHDHEHEQAHGHEAVEDGLGVARTEITGRGART